MWSNIFSSAKSTIHQSQQSNYLQDVWNTNQQTIIRIWSFVATCACINSTLKSYSLLCWRAAHVLFQKIMHIIAHAIVVVRTMMRSNPTNVQKIIWTFKYGQLKNQFFYYGNNMLLSKANPHCVLCTIILTCNWMYKCICICIHISLFSGSGWFAGQIGDWRCLPESTNDRNSQKSHWKYCESCYPYNVCLLCYIAWL